MEFVGRKLWVCRNETTGFSVGNFNFGPGPKMKTSTLDLAPASSSKSFCRASPAVSQLTQPSLTVREGFDLNPKPLCPLQGRGLTAQVGSPTFTEYIKVKMTIKGHF